MASWHKVSWQRECVEEETLHWIGSGEGELSGIPFSVCVCVCASVHVVCPVCCIYVYVCVVWYVIVVCGCMYVGTCVVYV